MQILANLFVDFLIWSSGTWVGAPQDRNPDNDAPGLSPGCEPASQDANADED